MNHIRSGIVLLLIQLALVLSVAGKYLYERETLPRVWMRAAQYDPETPLRGRYLALQMLVDDCALPHDENHNTNAGRLLQYNRSASAVPALPARHAPARWSWHVTLHEADGTLVPSLEPFRDSTQNSYELVQSADVPCTRGAVHEELNLFIPEHAKPPLPLKSGQELWVEVTVPKQGPPRPIQIALSDAAGFHPLKFN